MNYYSAKQTYCWVYKCSYLPTTFLYCVIDNWTSYIKVCDEHKHYKLVCALPECQQKLNNLLQIPDIEDLYLIHIGFKC